MDMIHIIVWDKDPIGKDFLGQCYIPASVCTSHPDTKVDLWVKLCDQKVKKKKDRDNKDEEINRGELRVMLCYNVSKIFKQNSTKTKLPNENIAFLKQSAAVVFKENAMANYDNKRFDIPSSEIKITKSLAEGTNAMVYFGKYRGQDVAIKELKQAVDPVQMKDFQTEFNLLCELKSPHIVLFYGASITEDYKIRMVFQFCPNGSLYDAINNNSFKLSWSKFFRASIQIAEAANFLHSWTPQILHRDIKSLNFLVDEYWNCKIADLGLSRKNEDNAETLKKMRGTYQYTPPESYNKEQPYIAKSDIYSLAIVFWELVQKCCTGVYMAPFKEYGLSYGFQILIKVAKEALRPTVHPNCPEVISDLIKKSWSTDPKLRPTAKEIILKFEEIHKTYREDKKKWDEVCACKNPLVDNREEVHETTHTNNEEQN